MSVMVLFGSGGHSSEMLMLMEYAKIAKKLSDGRIAKLICVISQDDQLIAQKLGQKFRNNEDRLDIVKLKRARRVGQPYLSSVFTTVLGILYSFLLIIKHKPNLCLTNGPAIAFTISLAIRFAQVATLGLWYTCDIIYIESFCRTKTLSLTGKLLYHMRLTSKFYVQWPELASRYSGACFKGLLV